MRSGTKNEDNHQESSQIGTVSVVGRTSAARSTSWSSCCDWSQQTQIKFSLVEGDRNGEIICRMQSLGWYDKL